MLQSCVTRIRTLRCGDEQCHLTAAPSESSDGNSPIHHVSGYVETLAGFLGFSNGPVASARYFVPMSAVMNTGGEIFVADSYSHVIRKISTTGDVTTFAGKPGEWGSADGSGSVARFNKPTGVAVDADLNIFLSDSGNHTVRKITAAGIVSTLAGSAGMPGAVDGSGALARFDLPTQLAVDSEGSVYVPDYNQSIIRKITAGGVVTTIAGKAENFGSVDGVGSDAKLIGPSGVSVDSNTGDIYFVDSNNSALGRITR